MPLPRWVILSAWLVFLCLVLAPIGQLIFDFFFGTEGTVKTALTINSVQWRLLGNSLILACAATIIALILGVPYSVFAVKTDVVGRSVFQLAALLPLLIPPYMQAIVWRTLLGSNSPINLFLMSFFGLNEPLVNINNLLGVGFVLGIAYFPYVSILTISGLKSFDTAYEEVALINRSPFSVLFNITLPLIWPYILSGATFVFVFSIIEFSVPDLFQVRTYPIEIFIQFSALFDERLAILTGFVLLLVTSIPIILQVYFMRGRNWFNFDNSGRSKIIWQLKRTQWGAIVVILFILFLTLFLPVGVLMNAVGSFSVYQEALWSSIDQIRMSLFLAFCSATVVTLLAFFIAHILIHSRHPSSPILEYIVQLPFAIPALTLGIGLIKFWNRPYIDWVYSSWLIIVVGHVAHFIPFAIRTILANFKQINPHLEQAGILANRGWFNTTIGITVPLCRWGILTGFLVVFVLSFSELGVSLLVIPPGINTIPIKIYNYMHYGADDIVAALCLLLIMIQLICIVSIVGIVRYFTPAKNQ